MFELNTGWLSPTGEFFKCPCYSHMETARYIAEKTGLLKNIYHADDDLIDAGYVLITRYSWFFHGWGIIWGLHNTLTSEQRRFLQPYFDNKEEIDAATMMRWLQEDMEKIVPANS